MLEFKGVNQSLPHLKSSPVVSNFRNDKASESLSEGSASEHLEDLYSPIDNRTQITPPTSGEVNHNYGVERWIEDFHIDIERRELGIPVEPVSLLFEDLSLTR